MRLYRRAIIAIIAIICGGQAVRAQYYSWGADRAALKWSTIQTDSVKVLYPNNIEHTARAMMHYISAISDDISTGFTHPQLKIPFVVHPENFSSNGMVMWAPLRIEFLSAPATESYSMPWVKQLVAHEYRHAVQYNNIFRSTIGLSKYLIGQQGGVVSLLLPPLYALEGDAVMMETQASSFGRGLQPSFSIGYRAAIDELLDKKGYMKWRCGSYLMHIPDHYAQGYQIMSYANSKYGENILNRTFEYSARNPQFILPYEIALRKFYGTSTKELFYETFGKLAEQWQPLSQVEESAKILSRGEERNFVTYSYPIPLGEGEILSLKSDYSNPSRFVIFDSESAEERVVAHTGTVSTRAAYAAGRVWWTEYRRSLLFDEAVGSQLCYMDLNNAKPQRVNGVENALYATPIGDSKEDIAYVEYDPSGLYSVVRMSCGREQSRTKITYPNEVHSMAWDNATQRLYVIVTGDEGMWIERETESGDFEPITKPAYITLSGLTARDGVLYFGSIASGKDEVHSLDITSGIERQLSLSKYGSFQPTMGADGLYMTTYDKEGYHLSRQGADEFVAEVEYSSLPRDVINPNRPKWDVVNLDEVQFDAAALDISEAELPSKRYRKALHLFNLHSWAPIRYNPLTLLGEMSFDVGLGATLLSQNLLSSCEGFLSYGWDHFEGSVLKTGVNYDGLGVNLGLSATYGGDQKVYMLSEWGGKVRNYADLTLSASLPLHFSRGYHTRYLTPYVGWNYSNGIIPYGLSVEYQSDITSLEEQPAITYKGVRKGLTKLTAGVSFSDYVRPAYRDLESPWGYTLSASYSLDPSNSDFSHLISLYGKINTPGFARNNSLTIAAAYQDAIGGFEFDGSYPLSYVASALIPRGFSYVDLANNDYVATSVGYKFPMCYPELGIGSMVYINRLSLGLGFDYAQYVALGNRLSSISSYGVDLMVDFNAVSLSSASTITATFSLYKPQERGLYFQMGFGLPF